MGGERIVLPFRLCMCRLLLIGALVRSAEKGGERARSPRFRILRGYRYMELLKWTEAEKELPEGCLVSVCLAISICFMKGLSKWNVEGRTSGPSPKRNNGQIGRFAQHLSQLL